MARKAWIPETPIWEDLTIPDGRKSSEARKRGRHLAIRLKQHRKRKARAALERRILAKKGKNRWRPPGLLAREKFTVCMRPGEWHSAADVTRAAGLTPNYLARFTDELLPRGYVERIKNHSWSPRRSFSGKSRWFYRLSRRGEIYRNLCLMLL